MVRYRFNFSKWSLACLLIAGGKLFGGDKIQFDIPTEREDQPIAVQERVRRLPTPSSGPSAPAPGTAFRAPVQAPQPMEKLSKEELEKKRNWLSSDPTEKEKTAEEVFNVTGFSTDSKEQQPSFLGNPLETGRPPTASLMEKSEKGQRLSPYERELMNPTSLFQNQTAAEVQTGFGLWDKQISSESQFEGLSRANNGFADFWSDKLNNAANNADKLNGSSAFSTSENSTRRSHVADLLERRQSEPINSFVDNSRQPVNPVEGVGAGAFAQTPQSSFTDQWKGNFVPQASLQRNALEDLRPKIATPLAPKVEITPPASSTWVKPQPGVLSIPRRPGSLF